MDGHSPIQGVKGLSDKCFIDFYGEGVHEDYFTTIQNKASEGETIEVMCHPAFADKGLMKGSSYNLERLKELEVLCSTKLPAGVELL